MTTIVVVAGSRRYELVYAPEVRDHVKTIEPRYHGLLRQTIEQQLTSAPDHRTRNREPLEHVPGPFGSTWELRCGPDNCFRVFYEIHTDPAQVWILAIGLKDRSRLYVGGREYAR
ncbi:MAG: addiction module toxin RelE [Thermoleophilia bacterium]|nr:addiction module toxin RelE [Thermoleophilia bacterium]